MSSRTDIAEQAARWLVLLPELRVGIFAFVASEPNLARLVFGCDPTELLNRTRTVEAECRLALRRARKPASMSEAAE